MERTIQKAVKTYQASFGQATQVASPLNEATSSKASSITTPSQGLNKIDAIYNKLFNYLKEIDDLKQVEFFKPKEQNAQQPLNELEQLVIFAYTTMCYKIINPILANDKANLDINKEEAFREAKDKEKLVEVMTKLIPLITGALAKLPEHEQFVFKGLTLSEDQLKMYQVGKEISNPRFNSASTSVKVAADFISDRLTKEEKLEKEKKLNKPGSPVLFQILSRTGKDIAPYTLAPKEKETLFPPSNHFKVIGREERVVEIKRQGQLVPTKVTIIQLAQISRPRR